MSKKCISILLAIVLSLSMISLVFAEETTSGDPADTNSQSETQTTESTNTTESTEATTPSDTTESTEATIPSDTTESTEATVPSNTTDSTDPSTPSEATNPTDPTTPSESTDPTDPTSPTEATNPTEPTTPTEATEPTDGQSSGESSTEPSTEAHTHTYTTIIRPATRTADGALTKVCNGCDDEIATPIARIASITLSNKNCVYSGNVKHPKVTVLDANGTALKRNTDYEVIYNGTCQKVGKYSATITFIGKYKGSATRYFNIIPKPSAVKTVKEYSSKMVVTVKTRTQTTGYQIKIATKKNFSDDVNKYIKDGTVSKKTIKGLAGDTTYYIKVRTYTKIAFNGKTTKVYSAWSDAVECKTR